MAATPKIYQNAWFTISASTADDASKGFLEDRCYLMAAFTRSIISLPYCLADGWLSSSGSIILGERPVPIGYDDKAPIHQRAWTYQ